MEEFRDDTSRLDAFLAARRRATVLHAIWRPVLAGAVASLAVSAAIWVILPKFSYREIEVPRVSYKDAEVPRLIPHDVQVDHVVSHDVPIDIPRIVAASPTPRSPEERAFVGAEGWKDAVIKGRILCPDRNGFVLMTDEGEQSFYPARIGPGGKIELEPSVEDVVDPFIDDLGYCRKLPVGTYECVALHKGREVIIRPTPIVAGRPT
jgi:hypothetical protein